MESLLQPELPADLEYLDSSVSSLLASSGCAASAAADARGILRALASAAPRAQAWAKPDQILAAAVASKSCACIYRDARPSQRPEVELQHYSSLRRLVALGAFGDALEHGARLSDRLHELTADTDAERGPGKELRDLLLGNALNMLVSCAETGVASSARGSAPIAQLHETLRRLQPTMALLPDAEQAKYTESIFRYLYKLAVQTCGGGGLDPEVHRDLLRDLFAFCAASPQRAKLPLIVSKLAADLPPGAKHCLLSAALACLERPLAGDAAPLHQALELLTQQAAQQGDTAAFLRGPSLPGGDAPAAAQLYVAALQLASEARGADVERASSHSGASTSGRQPAPCSSSGRGRHAAAAAASAAVAVGKPAYSRTLASYLQLVSELAQQHTDAALPEAACAAAATQALRAVVSQLAGQAPSLQRYARLFPTPASAALAAEALALAPSLLRRASSRACGSDAGTPPSPSAAAACALLALKIAAGLVLDSDSPSSQQQQLQSFDRHASSIGLLLPAAPAACSSGGSAAGQLAASLEQLSLSGSSSSSIGGGSRSSSSNSSSSSSSSSSSGGGGGGGAGALVGGELQWLSSCTHNIAVELLALSQPQTALQQHLAAAALQLACRACLCQLAAAGEPTQLVAEVSKKGRAYLGCLRKAGRLAQLVQEADGIMLQLYQVRGRLVVLRGVPPQQPVIRMMGMPEVAPADTQLCNCRWPRSRQRTPASPCSNSASGPPLSFRPAPRRGQRQRPSYRQRQHSSLPARAPGWQRCRPPQQQRRQQQHIKRLARVRGRLRCWQRQRITPGWQRQLTWRLSLRWAAYRRRCAAGRRSRRQARQQCSWFWRTLRPTPAAGGGTSSSAAGRCCWQPCRAAPRQQSRRSRPWLPLRRCWGRAGGRPASRAGLRQSAARMRQARSMLRRWRRACWRLRWPAGPSSRAWRPGKRASRASRSSKSSRSQSRTRRQSSSCCRPRCLMRCSSCGSSRRSTCARAYSCGGSCWAAARMASCGGTLRQSCSCWCSCGTSPASKVSCCSILMLGMGQALPSTLGSLH
jgi:hypothetical protein